MEKPMALRALAPLWMAMPTLLAVPACSPGTADERTGAPGDDRVLAGPTVGEDEVDKDDCTLAGQVCPVGQTCNPATRRCEAPVCDPACVEGQRCNASTRTCVELDPCDSKACRSGEKCYARSPGDVPEGADPAVCIPNCTIDPGGTPVACAEGRTCNAATGLCDCAGQPCPGDVGTACAGNDDCLGAGANRRCVGFFPQGYCTSECRSSECPTGSVCVDLGDFLCLDRCASHTDCREGYRCETLQSFDDCFTEGKVCVPDREVSTCEGPDCRHPGQACEDSDDCVDKGFCASAWPDGTCLLDGCDPNLGRDACPGSSTCVPGIFNAPTCMDGCSALTKDCRPNYWCAVSDERGSTGGCVPRSCDDDSDCVGEVVRSCAGEILRKTPNELCDVVIGVCDRPCDDDFDCGATCADMGSADCRSDRDGLGMARRCDRESRRCFTPCENDDICGVHGFCDGETGRCAPACEVDSECRPGERCAEDGRCKPPCTSDEQCPDPTYCDRGSGECVEPCQDTRDCPAGLECRRRIERCVRPLDKVNVGDACGRAEDCAADRGGDCLRNRDGFPGGYCTARDCNDVERCPEDSECRMAALPGGGDALTPACFLTCERRADCRESYACVDGVCQPEGLSVVGPRAEPPAEGEGEGEGEPPGGAEGEGEGQGE